MRLAIIYLGRKGSAYTINLIDGLLDNKVDILAIISQQNPKRNIFKKDSVSILTLKTFNSSLECILTSPFRLLFSLFKIFRALKKYKPDAVLCTMHHVWGPALGLFFKIVRMPYILVVHDARIHPGDGGFLRAQLLKWHIAFSTKWVALTNHVAVTIKNDGCPTGSVFVIPHGVLPYHVADKPREICFEKPIRITFFGRILEYKGLDILISAWPTVRDRIPNAILNVYGEGKIPKSPVLSTYASSIKIKNAWIKDEEIKKIFEATDIMVFPYREASQSGVIAIAFPAAIPVVVTPLLGLIEQLNYGGGVISKTLSPSDLSEAIISIACDHNKYHKLSAECINKSKALHWNQIAGQIKQAIQND
jgi:glycosyltransferase involved in cell wall biosynthesis